MQQLQRPKFMNLALLGLKMSTTAKCSILHRITGLILFLSVPLLLYVLNRSLVSASFYQVLYGFCSSGIMKVGYILLIFAFIYHLIAGIRFLFLDFHKGISLNQAKLTAKIVIIVSIILTAILGVLIW